MSDYPQVTYRKHTFLSALAMGLSAIAITLIISCTVVIIYGMRFAGDESEKLVALVDGAIQELPRLQESLPPVLADMLDHRREPDYSKQLEISAKTTLLPERNGGIRTTVTVDNNGDGVVSFLSLRIVIRNSRDEILAESNEWAATPIAADHDDWRGPLMPGSRRYFAIARSGAFSVSSLSDLKTEVEITDVRIWSGAEETSPTNTQVPSETRESNSPPTEPAELE
ncbi:MAG: hypothetical protein JSV03_10720 [Planctomycetota bacterium]|nr:MAG: hypothetical protein JSV03_10720 [Planctomycetota bacterium]